VGQSGTGELAALKLGVRKVRRPQLNNGTLAGAAGWSVRDDRHASWAHPSEGGCAKRRGDRNADQTAHQRRFRARRVPAARNVGLLELVAPQPLSPITVDYVSCRPTLRCLICHVVVASCELRNYHEHRSEDVLFENYNDLDRA
jgi:hypothetical protein